MLKLSSLLRPAVLAALVGLAVTAAAAPASARDYGDHHNGYSQNDRDRDSDRDWNNRGRNERVGWNNDRDWRDNGWRGDRHDWRDEREARRYWFWRHRHFHHDRWY
jgi:hypothetical protein